MEETVFPILATNDIRIDLMKISRIGVGGIIDLTRFTDSHETKFWCDNTNDGELIPTDEVSYYGNNLDNSFEYLKKNALGKSVIIIDSDTFRGRDDEISEIRQVIFGTVIDVIKEKGFVTKLIFSEKDTIQLNKYNKIKAPANVYLGLKVLLFKIIDDREEFMKLHQLFNDEKICMLDQVLTIKTKKNE